MGKLPTRAIRRCHYVKVHQWARSLKKKIACELCGEKSKRLEWSNKDHQYRYEPDDWWVLCRLCHKKHDKTIEGGLKMDEKVIFVPPAVHKKLKSLSVDKGVPMYQVIKELLKK